MIPVLNRPGVGFSIRELDASVTTSVAVERGDIVQLAQTSGGVWTTCAAPGAGTAFTAATYVDAPRTLAKTGAFSTVPNGRFTPITVSGATYTESTKTITKTGAFAAYTFTAGIDRFLVTGGTGATVGVYTVASKTSNDAITLTASIGAGADGQTDIGGTLAQSNDRDRVNITGGTAITTGVALILMKIDDNTIVLGQDIGTGAADVAFTLMSSGYIQGIFGCCLRNAAANERVAVRIIGNCFAFTKNSASGGGNAIAAGNLYAATSAKDLESDVPSYGVNAKLIAKAVGTGTAAATNTRALRLVTMSGIHGWGGLYGGAS